MIVNTCGWDTDSNSGNLGCLLGIKNGLAAIDAGPDWRGPVADRMFLPTADGGGAITDAATEAVKVANSGRGLRGLAPLSPKDGARFHFELAGSTQGFRAEAGATVENVAGFSELGARSLRLVRAPGAPTARMTTPTFTPPGASEMYMYELLASPTLYPGQTICARVVADPANQGNAACVLLIRVYDGDDRLVEVCGEPSSLAPGAATILEWRVPNCGGQPLAEVGLEWSCGAADGGAVHLDYLTWDGTPDVTLTRPAGGEMWQHAWVCAADHFESSPLESLRLVQNRGLGLLLHGSRDWKDYQVEASLSSLLAATVGLAARVEGQRRYYALELEPGSVRLVKARGDVRVLAETDFEWKFGRSYSLSLTVEGSRLRASIDGRQLFDLHDAELPLSSGGVGLLCKEGCVWSPGVRVRPLPG